MSVQPLFILKPGATRIMSIRPCRNGIAKLMMNWQALDAVRTSSYKIKYVGDKKAMLRLDIVPKR